VPGLAARRQIQRVQPLASLRICCLFHALLSLGGAFGNRGPSLSHTDPPPLRGES
jgi:hypothetical protein